MTPQGTVTSERTAPAPTPGPDGDPLLSALLSGLSDVQVAERLSELRWLSIEDPEEFQDWVSNTSRDPSPLDQVCLYHPDLLVENLAAVKTILGTVRDQLDHWRSMVWSDACRQAWPMYEQRRRQWEDDQVRNGGGGPFPRPNAHPALVAELEKRWDTEYRIRAATGFRRHMSAVKNELETRLRFLYPDSTAGATPRALARRDTIRRHEKFYLRRVRYYQEQSASRR